MTEAVTKITLWIQLEEINIPDISSTGQPCGVVVSAPPPVQEISFGAPKGPLDFICVCIFFYLSKNCLPFNYSKLTENWKLISPSSFTLVWSFC